MRLLSLAVLNAALLIAFASPAIATPPPGVDVLMSTVMQENQSSISGFALRGRLHSPALLDNVTIMPTLEWWRSSSHVEPYGIESTRNDNTLACDVRYEFAMKGMTPYLGGGMAVHFLSSKVNAPALGVNNATASLTKGGLGLLAGVTIPLTGRVQNFLELKYHHISDYRQLKLNWGIAVGL
ncbi:MAG TPA: opacity family porin [Candidatus Udaeobacter sp.]|jgi:opacity protein-like surface antigen|nr:opacity family porin [Candidatus Udaeobacter sp.]